MQTIPYMIYVYIFIIKILGGVYFYCSRHILSPLLRDKPNVHLNQNQ